VAILEEATVTPALRLAAHHDGYLKRFGVLHRRTIAATTEGLTVIDALLGGTRTAGIVFQLAPGLDADCRGGDVIVTRDGRVVLRMVFPDDGVTVTSGASAPDGGWIAPRFGLRRPACRVSWRGTVGEGGVTTRLVLGVEPRDDAAAAHRPDVETAAAEDAGRFADLSPLRAPGALDTHPAQT
jgi:hypothetical protein